MATNTKTKTSEPVSQGKATCGQCGRELKHVPFALNNIMCRDCYGLDRYRKTAPAGWTPEKPVEVAITDEEAPAAPAA